MTTLHFDSRPKFRDAAWRIVSVRRPGLKMVADLPPLTALWRDVSIDREHVAAYRTLCCIDAAQTLPFHYPHVLAGPMHVALLTQPEFPVGLLGAVHLRNHAIRYRAISVEERLDLLVETAGCRLTDKGIEFDLDTVASSDDEVVWRERTTFLVRQKTGDPDPVDPLSQLFSWEESGDPLFHFDVPAGIGRRYSKISRDFNPIHIATLLAKPFGFKRAIAHGMWNLARATAELAERDDASRVDVIFKGPLFIPGRASVKQIDDERFALYAPDDERPAMKFIVRPIAETETL